MFDLPLPINRSEHLVDIAPEHIFQPSLEAITNRTPVVLLHKGHTPSPEWIASFTGTITATEAETRNLVFSFPPADGSTAPNRVDKASMASLGYEKVEDVERTMFLIDAKFADLYVEKPAPKLGDPDFMFLIDVEPADQLASA